jgi:LSD1 subclass zinc finger protein
MSTVRLRRLQADYDILQAFLVQQPRIRLIQAQGAPPERYQLEYQVKGLREVDDQLQTVANHIVEIALPMSYPRLPPQCRMLTPVFHPNIAPHAICIGDHWSAGEPLWSMVARIGEMITYQSYNTKSPLNGEAARWVEGHQHELPLDRTSFMLDEPSAKAKLSAPAPAAPKIPVAATAAAAKMIIECGGCQTRYSVPPQAAGKRLRCKKCQTILEIPMQAAGF